MQNYIKIRGAREHNLKNVDIDFPRNKFIAVTGVSGSGKSSLAFDTVYAEGQRRYVESLSAYARQFLGQRNKPKIDSISGIPPAVAIQQKGAGYNPRSTVGTLTEIYDYFRLFFARIGEVRCPNCNRVIQSQGIDKIIEKITKTGQNKEISVIAPMVRGRKGNYRRLFDRLLSEGFVSVIIDGALYSLDEDIDLDGRKKHEIGVMVDRLKITGSQSNAERVTDSVEIAVKKSGGTVEIEGISKDRDIYSTHYACPVCEISMGKIEPRNFSFNSPYGACPTCSGLGVKLEIDSSFVVPDDGLSVNEGAIVPWSSPITTRTGRWKGSARRFRFQMIEKISDELNFSMDIPFKKLPRKIKDILLYGSKKKFKFKLKSRNTAHTKVSEFEGAVTQLKRRYLQTDSEYVREKIQKSFMRDMECPECSGRRLKKESLSVFVNDKNIADIIRMPVKEAKTFMENLKLTEYNRKIGSKIVKEIISRLSFLIDVGVDYVSLDRKASTLSSGEAERIRLATQIGSSLVGVVYILDEPTIGLHARDTKRLLKSLKELQEIGNTVMVVEHDSQTIDVADYIVDLGPRAGVHGGNIVFSGTGKDFKNCTDSLTADYYNFKKEVRRPDKTRTPTGKEIALYGCSQFNLKDIDVRFKVGLFNCVTGVSGSGKSTLVEEILYKAVKNSTRGTKPVKTGGFKSIEGTDHIKRVINIDQTPIGRTPRSNPVTYTKVLTPIRELFANLPQSRARGYKKGRFSFNVKEGTCNKCSGRRLKKESLS
ncbi:MAG: excinuclease ABC subunit UvrA, partial [Elusimicrobia bacterium]|nr:excinuclease ABC subunit UvrA [Elusimicrobiota bacterium]